MEYNSRKSLHLKGESRPQRKTPFHSAVNKTHITAGVKSLIGTRKTHCSGEATLLKYVEAVMGGLVFLGHHSLCRKPVKILPTYHFSTLGRQQYWLEPWKMVYGSYKVLAKKVKARGTEGMFPFHLPTES